MHRISDLWSKFLGLAGVTLAMVCFHPALAQTPAFLGNGMAAYYSFDSSWKGDLPRPTGGTTELFGTFVQTQGRMGIGSAFNFDGSSKVIHRLGATEPSPTSDAFSISCWLRASQRGASNQWWFLVHQGFPTDPWNSDGFAFVLQPTGSPLDGKVTFEMYNKAGVRDQRTYGAVTQGRVDNSRWHHLLGTFSKGKIALFLNGALQGETTAAYLSVSNRFPITIGMPLDAAGGGTRATIDEVRIFNRALSSGEVRNLYAFESAPSSPRVALVAPNVVNGFIVSATILDGGYGYTNPPIMSVFGGNGSGARLRCEVENGSVARVLVDDPGRNYTGFPTVSVASPPMPPRRATATAEVSNGFVVGSILTDYGYGYSTPPAVLIVGGGGSGATAVASIFNGAVSAIRITNPGSGYTGIPIIRIASPPFAPRVSIGFSKVRVTLDVVLGLKYQLETSSDLATWSPLGEGFVAQDEQLVQEFDVQAVGRFFRLQQIP